MVAQAPSTWTVNLASYSYQMTMTCKANEACVDLADTSNYIAAFVGTQCRGVVKTKTAAGNLKLGLLTVQSNVVSGEKVHFQVYKASTNTVLTILDTVTFSQGVQIGTLSNPKVLYTNHAPTNLQLSNNSIPENQPISTLVANLTATDPDAGTVFSYSLTNGQAENTQFQISSSQLLSNIRYDYEVDSIKLIEIQVGDNGGCSYTSTFTIHIINIDDTPTVVNLALQTVFNQQQAGDFIGKFSTVDEDFHDIHTYSLVSGIGSTDNTQFYIHNDTLYNVNQINFANYPFYHIRIRSTDLGGLWVEDTFAINVLTVNDPPTNILLSSDMIQENKPIGTTIGVFTTIDINTAATHTLTLESGLGGADNNKINLFGDTLKSNASYNYEAQDSLFIKVRTTVNNGTYYIQTFTIVVINVNEAPTDITLSNNSIEEGRPVSSFVGTFTSADQDYGDTHAYTLVTGTGDTDNALFTITSNSIVTAATFSYTAQTYSVRVRTTDSGNLFYEKAFTIVVTDSNFVPTNIIASTTSFNENIAIGTKVLAFTTIDYNVADTAILTLVSGPGSTDNAYFSIAGDSLQTDSAVDFEKKNIYYIRVKSTEPGNTSVTKTFTLTVNNLNEAPTDISLSADSILELQPIGTAIGNFSSTDEDIGDTHTYSLVTGIGSTDNSLFTISGNQLQSSITYTFTNQIYSIRVQTMDAGGLTFEKVFPIKIINVNQAPTDIILDTVFVNEDNDPMFHISKIKSIDPDSGDAHTYNLVSGQGADDNDEFVVENDNLIIINKTNYDVKPVYHIRLKSQDAGGLSVQKAFDIQVKDVAGDNIQLPSTNYISPNGDGKNDFWVIDNVEIYKDFQLQVFDQFGQIIYSVPNNYNNEFDGTYRGNALPTGNYYYVFKNDSKIFKGNITIVN